MSLVLASLATFVYLRYFKSSASLELPALRNLDNQVLDPELIKGRVCVVSFFQTWCSDCVKEQPELQKLQDHFGKDSLAVLMISDEPVEKIRAFKQQFQSGLDFYSTDVPLKKELGIKGYPTTYLLSKTGEVKEMKVEGINWYTPETIRLVSKLLRQDANR